MREIKFRAWYKPLGQMIQPDRLEHINFEVKVLGVYIKMEDRGFHKLRMSDFELMQYTERTDSKGEEIFQSDLWEYHGVIYVVSWNSDESKFYFRHPNAFAGDDDHIDMGWSSHGNKVGNIYDNPELLIS